VRTPCLRPIAAAAASAATPTPTPAPPAASSPLSDAALAALLRPHAPRLALAAACLTTCTACNLASPVLTGVIFDSLVGGVPPALGRRALGLLAVLYALEPALTRVYIATTLDVVEGVVCRAREAAFRALLTRSMPFFDARPDLTGALTGDLETVRAFCFASVSRDRGPRAALEAAGAVAVLTALSWRLGPVLAAVIASAGAGAALYRVQARGPEAAAASASASMRGVAAQAFAGIATVRACAAEGAEAARFAAAAADAAAAGRVAGRAKATLEALTRLGIHASLLALFGLGGSLVRAGLLPPGVLLSAVGFTYSLVYAVAGLVATVADGRRAAAAGGRVRALLASAGPEPGLEGVLAAAATPAPDAAAARAAASTGDLTLSGVCFAYPSRPATPVLAGLDLTLARGRVTALVGRSGAGKSTVAALLTRLYAPTGGRITLAGTPVTSFSRAAWAATVAVVPQDPIIFAGTVAENIAYARPGASRAEVEAAAAAAQCAAFIADLPHGYDTRIGPGGVEGGSSSSSSPSSPSASAGALSGGQRQRLAIARAILQDAPILILDEATSGAFFFWEGESVRCLNLHSLACARTPPALSRRRLFPLQNTHKKTHTALDAESEAGVQAGLRALVAGRTVLVIAHRLSTVRSASGGIAVLADGRIGEFGGHGDLAAAGGLYARLVAAQALMM
jgi:ATP-binding cassette subfamily B (MDR/TAP) protein 8